MFILTKFSGDVLVHCSGKMQLFFCWGLWFSKFLLCHDNHCKIAWRFSKTGNLVVV